MLNVLKNNYLYVRRPDLLTEWDYEKNIGIDPKKVTFSNSKKIWWICKNLHKWEASINSRTSGKYKNNCPYCSGRRVCKDNCLATLNPKLASEWHPTKNGKLTSKDITSFSGKIVWWICKDSHIWEESVGHRSNGCGCPYCSGHRASTENCLATLYLELSKEWHPIKNDNLTPFDVTCGSHKKVWWVCGKCGNEWEKQIKERTSGKKNTSLCPFCYGRKVCSENCLATVNPTISQEWDYNKNGKLDPSGVIYNSSMKVWWEGKCGHKWDDTINHRTLNKRGCPYCSGKRVCSDNCLAVLDPILAVEWHPIKNGQVTPYNILPCSHKKVFWKCSKGHEWIATPHDRSSGNGCPMCNGVILYGKILCNSIPEAYKYLEYKNSGIKFKHNKMYDQRFGRHRYDFYIIEENKYIEITSFGKNNNYGRSHYIRYLREIVKKKKFVENVLKAKFEFIQFTPTTQQIKMVKSFSK